MDLIATSGAALGAPDPVWIVVGVIGLLTLVYAGFQWKAEGDAELGTTASDEAQAVQHSQIEGDVQQIRGKNIAINSPGARTGDVYEITTPQPEIHAQWLFQNRPANGEYHSRLAVHIDAPYAFDSLYIRAEADSMKRMDALGVDRIGHSRQAPDSAEPGVVFTTIPKPPANIQVELFTAQPDEFDIAIEGNSGHPTLPKAGDDLWTIGG